MPCPGRSKQPFFPALRSKPRTAFRVGFHLLRRMVSTDLAPIEQAKKQAAIACAEKNVTNGCRLGVGSGSTVKYLIEHVGLLLKDGKLKNIVCIPTSFQTKQWLLNAGLPVSDLDHTPELDVCIDGADEVDSALTCIKGGGGCLAREKIVQHAASKFFVSWLNAYSPNVGGNTSVRLPVIADSSKESNNLGEHYNYVPIEVLPFAAAPLLREIPRVEGGSAVLRTAGGKCGPVITDNNNYILDWTFDKAKKHDWAALQIRFANTPGIVETGLFVGVTDAVFFAYPDGSVKEVARKA